jgi:hypothetical protein
LREVLEVAHLAGGIEKVATDLLVFQITFLVRLLSTAVVVVVEVTTKERAYLRKHLEGLAEVMGETRLLETIDLEMRGAPILEEVEVVALQTHRSKRVAGELTGS